MRERLPGHTVLAVPVTVLDTVVRERTACYDASYVSTDPGFVHAHVTMLAPWVPHPTGADRALVARIALDTPAFEVELAELGVFPDGVVHLRPEPDGPLRRLTSRLAAAFPDFPPYGGRYDDPAPHLTLDRLSASVTLESVRARIDTIVPATVAVDRIDLQWWTNDDCRLLATFPLAPG